MMYKRGTLQQSEEDQKSAHCGDACHRRKTVVTDSQEDRDADRAHSDFVYGNESGFEFTQRYVYCVNIFFAGGLLTDM